jgi:small redox-active disulfide protein 2
MSNKQLIVEVIGVDPPCPRCKATYEVVQRVVLKLGVKAEVIKRNIMSDEVIDKYGILISPAVAVNGQIKIKGKVPSEKEVEDAVKASL